MAKVESKELTGGVTERTMVTVLKFYMKYPNQSFYAQISTFVLVGKTPF
jgi:hypothetical protein